MKSDVMKINAAILFLGSASASASSCLGYSGEVVLRGVLSRHTFAEQPNYESIAKGDAAATFSLCHLASLSVFQRSWRAANRLWLVRRKCN